MLSEWALCVPELGQQALTYRVHLTMFTQIGAPTVNRNRIYTLFAFLLAILLTYSGASRADAENTLMILGDSLSAAYGVPLERAWVSLLEQRLEREGLQWQVANESISGETTDGGLRRLPDLLAKIDPDIVVVELGGNDGLRGFPPKVIRENVSQIIEQAQDSGAEVLLIGMQIPPNYGSAYTNAFRSIFPELAREHQTALVPFFLKDVYDREGAMQADGIHPNASSQQQLLDNVWPELAPLLEKHQVSTVE